MTIRLEDFWNELPKKIAIGDSIEVALFLHDFSGLWPLIQKDLKENASLAYVCCIAIRIAERDINAQSEGVAQALGSANLLAMQREQARPQHPAIHGISALCGA